MERSPETLDETLNELVDEIVRLTGENYVVAMCQALRERRDRLVSGPSAQAVRVRLEAEIPAELLDR